MNAFLRLAIIGLAVLGLPGVAGAQSEATIEATVRISEPLVVTISTQLDFGHLKADKRDGTVTVTPSGERTQTGGAKLLGVKKDDPIVDFGPAEFTISGQPNAAYSIVFPASPTAAPEAGTPVLLVTALTSSPSGTGTIGANGFDSILVGGTLVVPAGTGPGVFLAVITLTISY